MGEVWEETQGHQEWLKFLRKMFCLNSRNQPAGGRCPTLKADSFAYHPYDFNDPPTRRFRPGPKQKRVKRIAVMDMDGAGVKYLTSGEKLVVTPAFWSQYRRPRPRSAEP